MPRYSQPRYDDGLKRVFAVLNRVKADENFVTNKGVARVANVSLHFMDLARRRRHLQKFEKTGLLSFLEKGKRENYKPVMVKGAIRPMTGYEEWCQIREITAKELLLEDSANDLIPENTAPETREQLVNAINNAIAEFWPHNIAVKNSIKEKVLKVGTDLAVLGSEKDAANKTVVELKMLTAAKDKQIEKLQADTTKRGVEVDVLAATANSLMEEMRQQRSNGSAQTH